MSFPRNSAAKILILLALTGLLVPSADAFPVLDFGGRSEIAQRYDATVSLYESKYDVLRKANPAGQISAQDSRRLANIEKGLATAYKNLATATAPTAVTRQNLLIGRYVRSLDREIARIAINQSK